MEERNLFNFETYQEKPKTKENGLFESTKIDIDFKEFSKEAFKENIRVIKEEKNLPELAEYLEENFEKIRTNYFYFYFLSFLLLVNDNKIKDFNSYSKHCISKLEKDNVSDYEQEEEALKEVCDKILTFDFIRKDFFRSKEEKEAYYNNLNLFLVTISNTINHESDINRFTIEEKINNVLNDESFPFIDLNEHQILNPLFQHFIFLFTNIQGSIMLKKQEKKAIEFFNMKKATFDTWKASAVKNDEFYIFINDIINLYNKDEKTLSNLEIQRSIDFLTLSKCLPELERVTDETDEFKEYFKIVKNLNLERTKLGETTTTQEEIDDIKDHIEAEMNELKKYPYARDNFGIIYKSTNFVKIYEYDENNNLFVFEKEFTKRTDYKMLVARKEIPTLLKYENEILQLDNEIRTNYKKLDKGIQRSLIFESLGYSTKKELQKADESLKHVLQFLANVKIIDSEGNIKPYFITLTGGDFLYDLFTWEYKKQYEEKKLEEKEIKTSIGKEYSDFLPIIRNVKNSIPFTIYNISEEWKEQLHELIKLCGKGKEEYKNTAFNLAEEVYSQFINTKGIYEGKVLFTYIKNRRSEEEIKKSKKNPDYTKELVKLERLLNFLVDLGILHSWKYIYKRKYQKPKGEDIVRYNFQVEIIPSIYAEKYNCYNAKELHSLMINETYQRRINQEDRHEQNKEIARLRHEEKTTSKH